MKLARWAGLLAAIVGAIVLSITWAFTPTRASYGWLVGVVFGYTLACGALLLLMIGYATNAVWLVVIRRPIEAIVGTLPLFALLFVPILLSIDVVYDWAPGGLPMTHHEHELVRHKTAWLNEPFFVARSVLYLVVPVLLGEPLLYWSRRQDRRRESRARALRVLSGLGLPLLVVVTTFAMFDWIMSLEPSFYSTSFGMIPNTGGFVALVGIVALVIAISRRRGALESTRPAHTHALGKVMLASLCFWAYLAFTQYLIIWIADLPNEVRWYLPRTTAGWRWVGYAMIIGHFALPFAALLSRELKRRPALLAIVGLHLVAMHWLELWWFALPAIRPSGSDWSFADPAAVLVVLGATALTASLRLIGLPLVPRFDPLLERSLRYRAE